MFTTIKRFFNKRFDRYYRHKRWRLILDTALVIVILLLAVAIFSLSLYQPKIDLSFLTKTPSQPVIIDFDEPPLKLTTNLSKALIYQNEEVELNLILKNDSAYNIDNINLNIYSKNEDLSISKLKFADNSIQEDIKINNNSIIINSLETKTEKNINIIIDFNHKLAKNREIYWEINSEYQVLEQIFTSKSELPNIKIAADLKVQAAAYYNSPQGDQLGAGPLPPVVDLPTNFWVFFRVDTEHNFSDFLISAKLPNNVNFTDNTSLLAGKINFNPDSRQIIWQIPDIEPVKDNYRAGIELQIIPTNSQIGQFANLLENIKYQTTDNFTGLKVNNNINNITTALEYDLINQGEGRVRSLTNESELEND